MIETARIRVDRQKTINQEQFTIFVVENADWFRGPFPETEGTLRKAEERLGVRLSTEMKWLLKEWGYGHAVGIDSLGYSIDWTLRVRELTQMPRQYVLLHNWDDAGLVLMDTATINAEGEPRVLWVYSPPAGNEPSEDEKIYPTFADWCVYRLEEEKDFLGTPDATE